MKYRSIGFIGGGRMTQIILQGLARKNRKFGKVVVSDLHPDVRSELTRRLPAVKAVQGDVGRAAASDLVFIALHPPAAMSVLGDMKKTLNPKAIVVSLAPKLTIGQLSDGLGGFQRIVRIIPNAPSIINQGFNPVAFAPVFTREEKKLFIKWFQLLGDCIEVEEDHLEAYAVITAMGPACLWFQLNELQQMGQSFGLPAGQVARGLKKMIKGMSNTFFKAGLSPEEVMDLIPVKPLGADEETIKAIYHRKLEALYGKLKT